MNFISSDLTDPVEAFHAISIEQFKGLGITYKVDPLPSSSTAVCLFNECRV